MRAFCFERGWVPRGIGALGPAALWAGLGVWAWVGPKRGMTGVGPLALAEAAFALALGVLLVLLGGALGGRVLRGLGLAQGEAGEDLGRAIPVGLVLLGYPVYALGLVGLFRPFWIFLAVGGLFLVLGGEVIRVARAVGRCLMVDLPREVRALPPAGRLVLLLFVPMGLYGLIIALAPPTIYDALWYHLQAPRLFLAAGRIYPEPHNWPANYAFAGSMLYAIPLALGNDTAPALLHLTFGALLLAHAYRIARRHAPATAWAAPALLLTAPAFIGRLAAAAMVDLIPGVLELLAAEAILEASGEHRRQGWRAAGLYLGLALGTKLGAAPAVLACVLLGLWRARGRPWRETARDLLALLAPAALLAAPWYGKNALWFGTPFFPAGFRGSDPETAFRAWLLVAYTNADYIESPWPRPVVLLGYLLFRPDLIQSSWSPLWLFALPLAFALNPAAWRWGGWGWAVARVVLWTLGPPRGRYLMGAFALVGVVFAMGLQRGEGALIRGGLAPRVYRFGAGLLLAWLLFLSVIHGKVLWDERPWAVVLGLESRAEFLERWLFGFRGMTFVAQHLSPSDRVLLIGDARHYYCPAVCDPEADHFTWPRLVWAAGFQVEALRERLRQRGVTHLWVSRPDLEWLQKWDPGGWVGRSVRFLYEVFLPRCGERIYADAEVEIFRLTCLAGPP